MSTSPIPMPYSVLQARLWCHIPGWAASWPSDRSPENEAEILRAIAIWRSELEADPTAKRAVGLVAQHLGAVLMLDPVPPDIEAARDDLLAYVCTVAGGQA